MSVKLFGKSGQGWASLALAGVATAAVIAGIAIDGGPMYARKEKRDDERMTEVNRFSVQINCLSERGNAIVMPTDFTPTDECPAEVSMKDPYTGEPYKVEPLENGKYRICAPFELTPEETRRYSDFDRHDNCVLFSLPREAAQPLLEPAPPEAPLDPDAAVTQDEAATSGEPQSL